MGSREESKLEGSTGPLPAAGASGDVPTCALLAKWQGKTIELPALSTAVTVGEVKEMLQRHTNVLPKRQKLVGLNLGGKPAPDECALGQIKLKDPHRFMLVGTPEAHIFVDPEDCEDIPEVFDDFDLDVTHQSKEWARAIENSENLNKFTAQTELHFIHPARDGKGLLVLDLDHTLLDFSSRESASAQEMRRPHMDAFLSAVYPHYDLCVWSQTRWNWLEMKLTHLGMLTNPNYRICMVLDKTAMFHVTSTLPDGQDCRHQVKPLKIIWDKQSRWNASNTLHVDDLARNFALNPECGVKVKAYRRRKEGAEDDQELALLARYLCAIAVKKGGWQGLDHMQWKNELARLDL